VATVVTTVALYKVHDVSHVSQHKAVGLTADSDLIAIRVRMSTHC
jgi:hypothetical protein